jgi:hypothetical protein
MMTRRRENKWWGVSLPQVRQSDKIQTQQTLTTNVHLSPVLRHKHANSLHKLHISGDRRALKHRRASGVASRER